MSILSDWDIQNRVKAGTLLINPWEPQAKQTLGMSYGLSCCGYDIRLGWIGMQKEEATLLPPGGFILCSSLEEMSLPTDLCGVVHDKSSWARQGLALQNTVLEPGWRGWITLELSNHGTNSIRLLRGQPIAQVLFHQLASRARTPYNGKYQNQPDQPVASIYAGEAKGKGGSTDEAT